MSFHSPNTALPFRLWKEMPQKIRDASPVVHCMTNYVTACWCADMLLAAGAAPIMADEPDEMEEIVAIAGALVLNIGTFNKSHFGAMRRAATQAKRLGKPILLDPVGAGASRTRTEAALSLLDEYRPAVVRGNISEILALAGRSETSRGVEADPESLVSADRLDAGAELAVFLAKKWECVVAISGPFDIISDGQRTCAIGGGDPMMTRITGCGCMQSALIGAYLAVEPDPWSATAVPFSVMSLCGAQAARATRTASEGTGSFRVRFLDQITNFLGSRLANTEAKML